MHTMFLLATWLPDRSVRIVSQGLSENTDGEVLTGSEIRDNAAPLK
jgi:hypothetical protein